MKNIFGTISHVWPGVTKNKTKYKGRHNCNNSKYVECKIVIIVMDLSSIFQTCFYSDIISFHFQVSGKRLASYFNHIFGGKFKLLIDRSTNFCRDIMVFRYNILKCFTWFTKSTMTSNGKNTK